MGDMVENAVASSEREGSPETAAGGDDEEEFFLSENRTEGQWLAALAEKEGYSSSQFDEKVWDVLMAAITYKIRTLVDEAVKISRRTVRHSPVVLLDANSVTLAAKLLNWVSLPRCPSVQPDEKKQQLDLDAVLSSEYEPAVPPIPTIRIRWAVIDGKIDPEAGCSSLTSQAEMIPSWRFSTIPSFERDFRAPFRNDFYMSVILNETLQRKRREQPAVTAGGNSALSKNSTDESQVRHVLFVPKSLHRYLADEHRVYLERITEVVLTAIDHMKIGPDGKTVGTEIERSHDKLAVEKVLRSLVEGPLPPKLVPYILALICNLVPDGVLDGPPEAVSMLLHLLMAFTQNTEVKIFAYLHQILHCLLICLLTPSIGSNTPVAIHEGLDVRRIAAEGLEQVLTIAGTSGSTAAFASVVEILYATLQHPDLPLTTLIGAVLGAQKLGPRVVEIVVGPVARDLIEALRESATERSSTSSPDNLEFESAKTGLQNYLLELLMAAMNK